MFLKAVGPQIKFRFAKKKKSVYFSFYCGENEMQLTFVLTDYLCFYEILACGDVSLKMTAIK